MTWPEMSWSEARAEALDTWRKLRRKIDTLDDVELLTEINARFALCEKARAEAGDELRKCPRCVFFEQYGGCREVSGEMSERVAEHDREGLVRLLDEFIGQIEALEMPDAWP